MQKIWAEGWRLKLSFCLLFCEKIWSWCYLIVWTLRNSWFLDKHLEDIFAKLKIWRLLDSKNNCAISKPSWANFTIFKKSLDNSSNIWVCTPPAASKEVTRVQSFNFKNDSFRLTESHPTSRGALFLARNINKSFHGLRGLVVLLYKWLFHSSSASVIKFPCLHFSAMRTLARVVERLKGFAQAGKWLGESSRKKSFPDELKQANVCELKTGTSPERRVDFHKCFKWSRKHFSSICSHN